MGDTIPVACCLPIYGAIFPTVSLIQTQRMNRVPVLLFGKRFWDSIVNFRALADAGTIGEADLDLFHFVETAETAWDLIRP